MGRDTPFASPWEGTNHANGETSPSAWEGRVITDTWIHKPLRQVVLLLIFSSTRSLCPCARSHGTFAGYHRLAFPCLPNQCLPFPCLYLHSLPFLCPPSLVFLVTARRRDREDVYTSPQWWLKRSSTSHPIVALLL